MDILKAYGLFDYSLYSGNRTVDFTDMLEPSTTYVAVAFGYNGGRTTKIFESEPFTTSAAASGTVAKTVRSRRHGSLGAFRPERRSIEKRLSVDAGSPAWHPRAVLLGGRPARIAVAGVARRAVRRRGVASAPFLRVRNPEEGVVAASGNPFFHATGQFPLRRSLRLFFPFEEIDLAPLHLAVHRSEFGDRGRNILHRVGDGLLALLRRGIR